MKNGHPRTLEQRFGRRLRKARLAVGLSQVELARATSSHFTNISQMERGKNLPSFRTLRLLCAALHQDADYLLVRRGR